MLGRSDRLIRRAALVHELPLPVHHQRLKVVVRIAPFVTRSPVSHLEVQHFFAVSLIRWWPWPDPALKPAHMPGDSLVRPSSVCSVGCPCDLARRG